jgi:hypothetical protein
MQFRQKWSLFQEYSLDPADLIRQKERGYLAGSLFDVLVAVFIFDPK